MKLFNFFRNSALFKANLFSEKLGLEKTVKDRIEEKMWKNETEFIDHLTSNSANLKLSSLWKKFHSGYVVAKTPGSFLSNDGDCQKMDFRWLNKHVAEIAHSEVREEGVFKNSKKRMKNANRFYGRTLRDWDNEVNLLDFFYDAKGFDKINARLSEKLYGHSGMYAIGWTGTTDLDGEDDMAVIIGNHEGEFSAVIICEDPLCDFEENFDDINTAIDIDFTDVEMIYPDNRATFCVHENADVLCDPCWKKDNCYTLIDCNEEVPVQNDVYATIPSMKNNFRLSMDIKSSDLSSSSTSNAAIFTVTDLPADDDIASTTTDTDGSALTKDVIPIRAYSGSEIILGRSYTDTSYNIVGAGLWPDTDLDYFTTTIAVSRVAGFYINAIFIEADNPHNVVIDHDTSFANEIEYGEMTVRGGDSTTTNQAYDGNVKNAYVQLGSFQDILNERFV